MERYTLLLIKPNATAQNKIGEILKIVKDNSFTIEALEMMILDNKITARFYAEHKGKPFYEPLVKFMHSGKTVAAVLKRENAVTELRKIVGNTDPAKAESGTIRHLYGNSLRENAVHASDSVENARREISIIFPDFFKK